MSIMTSFAAVPAKSTAGTLSCDDSLKSRFAIDADTTVTLTRFFKKGDNLNLDGTQTKKTAARDLCMTYADMARAQKEGAILDSAFAGINTDDPDLTGFRDRGGRMLFYYGMADQLIPIQGSTRYYESAAEKMGGYAALQRFYRYYPVPGMGHCFGTGSVNGVAGVSPAANPPLPAPGQLFLALTDWVEKNQAPENIVLRTADDSASRPLCAFPAKLRYMGGDRARATSYACKS